MCLLSLPTAPSSHMRGVAAFGYRVSALCGLSPLPDGLAGLQPLAGYLFFFWDWTLNLCLDSHPAWIPCYNPLSSAWWFASGHLPPLLMALFTSRSCCLLRSQCFGECLSLGWQVLGLKEWSGVTQEVKALVTDQTITSVYFLKSEVVPTETIRISLANSYLEPLGVTSEELFQREQFEKES